MITYQSNQYRKADAKSSLHATRTAHATRTIGWMLAIVLCGLPSSAWAQVVPPSADPARVDVKTHQSATTATTLPIQDISTDAYITTAPEGAENITITISNIVITGAHAFSKEDLAALYAPYLNKKTNASTIWKIAEDITLHYRKSGYFLSRAFVPAQEIDGGTVYINIVEGYIHTISFSDETLNTGIVADILQPLRTQKPLRAATLETVMLRLNALPSQQFKALIEPLSEDASSLNEGGVQLSLQSTEQESRTSVTLDNYGSRFLGPFQTTLTHQNSFIHNQKSTISALSTLDMEELNYLALAHEVPLASGWSAHISGNYVMARPGFLLESSDIESNSSEISTGLQYRAIVQRDEQLDFGLHFSAKDTRSDILGDTPLTRDHIRSFSATMHYSTLDAWQGWHAAGLTLKQGIDALGASKQGDANLSREEADADFTTLELTHQYASYIAEDVQISTIVAGQVASDALFSSEEFGYGGQSIGRAYDPSEITGDHGIGAYIELGYTGINTGSTLQTTPFMFYDHGVVWNEDAATERESGSSAGLGVRFQHAGGLSGSAGIAWPLSRSVANPISGHEKNPRLLFQLSHGF